MAQPIGKYRKPNTIISLQNVGKSYSEKEVLRNISMHVQEGEFVSLLGPSGSGKSTIFNIVAGLQEVTTGVLSISDTIGYMQQKDLLLPWKTILENIVLPLDLQGKNKQDSRQHANELIDKVGLRGYENKYPRELSGGMRQRANFLRTFISSQKILLLDEPFGALDSITKGNMQKWLLSIKEEFGVTILFITHDIEEAVLLSDRIYVISSSYGQIKEEIHVDFLSDQKEQRLHSPDLLRMKQHILSML
ncbi:ABC transporter ATP-binding protein [Psychrobacillus sp. BM2]|uniref:ABC transporter ATP-binding protein n=1 Tax=Psychrobacillus sp. BM2 TaxID=3400421 RepID=UPI003B02AC61